MHVELRDAAFALTVTLDYRAHAEHDLTERWATVLNGGTDTLSLERVWSAVARAGGRPRLGRGVENAAPAP